MDSLMLSRIQFAVTAMFHFIFVPLTLGLSILVAYMESRYVGTGDQTYLKMAKFWGKLFLINFALGIVTGITMEFQFGMNWAEYSRYVGDIFGAPLAIEGSKQKRCMPFSNDASGGPLAIDSTSHGRPAP